jgi:hypothetical protein
MAKRKGESEAQYLARRQNELRRERDRAVYKKVGSEPAGIKKKPMTAYQKEMAAQAKHDAKYGTGRSTTSKSKARPKLTQSQKAAATRKKITGAAAPSGYHALVGAMGKRKKEKP